MSTTTDLRVALEFTRMEQGSRSGSALLFRVLVSNMMQRGADLAYLSIKPSEKEVRVPTPYAPCFLLCSPSYLRSRVSAVSLSASDVSETYWRSSGVELEGVKYTIIDVVPFFPS